MKCCLTSHKHTETLVNKYKQDLMSNTQQELICHKTQQNQSRRVGVSPLDVI